MFIIDSTIHDLNVKLRDLYKVLFSVNIHQVATPELTTEDAKSYVFIFHDGGKFQAYIGLYFPHTDRKLYYRHDANPFSEGELSAVEDEARNFSEDLGATLDELDISKMSGTEKDRWIKEQDIFSERKQELPAEAAPVQDRLSAEHSEPLARETAVSVSASSTAQNESDVDIEPAPSPRPAEAIQAEETTESAPQPAMELETQPELASKPPSPVRPQARPVAPPQPSAASRSPKRQTSAPAVKAARDQVLKTGLAQSARQRASNDNEEPSGVAGREKEALARLLASF